jgi:hypothetical protein
MPAEAMPGPRERELDLPESLPAGAAVDLRRFGEILRHLAEEAVDQPDREGHVQRDIGEDQPKCVSMMPIARK